MLTDDDLVTQLRGSYAGSVAPVSPAPGLLERVHHEHSRSVRRQRLLVPAGVAVLGLAGAAAFSAWPSAPPAVPQDFLGGSATPSPEALPGPTVKLFDYTFTLPSGFVVDSVKHVDLSKQQPPQPVHGKTAFFEAHNGEQLLSVTVYRGPIADAQATVQPPDPGSVRIGKIAGFPSKTYSYAAGGPHCITKENGRSLVRVDATGPCSQEGSETRVETAPHELIWVMAQDVWQTTVDAVLESGL
jgi:hypothetical protein